MPDMGAGPRIFKSSTAASSFTLTPQNPYSAVVRRILIDKVSAADTWTCSIAGQEVMTFRMDTVGHQQLLSAATGSFPSDQDLFAFAENVLQDPITIGIQTGQTLTISSTGGATADISVIYEEFPQASGVAMGVNSSQSNSYYVPVYGYISGTTTTVGDNLLSGQYGLSFIPQFLKGGVLPQGWTIDVVAWFLEGAGVNTYSGSADHQSNTTQFVVVKNGQRLFTRDASGGIPLVGTASAAGSANTVYGSDYTPYPAFQDADPMNWRKLDPPFTLRAGDNTNFYLTTTGSQTGGADYSHALQVFLCKIRES